MSIEYPDRRRPDPVLELIADKVVRMESAMDKLTEAITKLAVIEEKQSADRQALERAFMAIQKSDERCQLLHEKTAEKLEKIDSRLGTLEANEPTQSLTSGWVLEAVKGLAVIAAVYALTKTGLMG